MGTERRRRPGRACCSAPSATRSSAPRSAALDEPYREVVALRFFADRSLAEIAEVDRPAARHREDPPPPGSRATSPRDRGGGTMTAPRPFGPGELEGAEGATADEVVAESRIARDLEGLAGHGASPVPAGFIDGVMAAVEAEPVPAPALAAGQRAPARRDRRRSSPPSATRSASSAGRGSRPRPRPGAGARDRRRGFAAGTGVAAAGVVGLIRDDGGRPSPRADVRGADPGCPSPSPAMPSPSVETPTPDQSAVPTATDDTPTDEPTGTRRPTATDDHGGGGSGGSGGGGAGGGGGRRPRDPAPDGGAITAARVGAVAATMAPARAMAARVRMTARARAPAEAAGTTGADPGLGRRVGFAA